MWWVRSRLHSSWLIAIVSICFVGGVTIAQVLRIDWWLGVVAFLAVLLLSLFRHILLLPVIIIASLTLGMGYGSAHLGLRDGFKPYMGKIVELSGSVKEDPVISKSGSTSVQINQVEVEGVPQSGDVYVSIRGSPKIKRADVLVVTGRLEEGFGSFVAKVSTFKLGSIQRYSGADVGGGIRDWFSEKVRGVIGEPFSSLGLGFLTGQKSNLPQQLSDDLKTAGLTHIVVASGYNLTILVRLARRLFVRLSKYLAVVSSGALVLLFMTITGLSPSMTRAGLVAGISLMAWYYGHKLNPFILLPFTAAITVCFNPSYVWGDVGWQLSFLAFAGVMIVAPLLDRYFFGDTKAGILRQVLGETVAAHLVTLPIIAINFGMVSHVAVFANILVVPLVPLAMLLTFIGGLWSVFNLPFSIVIAFPASLLLGYMVNITQFLAGLEWAKSNATLPIFFWLIYGLLLLAGCLFMWRQTKLRFNEVNILR